MNNINKLLEYMNKNDIEAFFINSYENRRYFSGFTGSNGYLIITNNTFKLITDQRYTEQAEIEAKDYNIYTHKIDPFITIKEQLTNLNIKTIGYESKRINDYLLRKLKSLYDEIEWIPTEDVGISIRAVKNEDEITNIKKAVEIADKSFEQLVKAIRPGITENDVMIELEYLMRKNGSQAPAFNTIVASGKRSSLPHGFPTNKKINKGEVVVIDFGANYNGYMSDITRTIWIGEPEKRIKEIFDIVLESQEEAIKSITKGKKCLEIDKAHRDVFIKYDLEKYSLRGLGHGVGLEIHEYPRVVMNNEEIIKENMVFTVEPGIYIPDVGGDRTEDIVLVTNNGCKVLTKSPKKIVID